MNRVPMLKTITILLLSLSMTNLAMAQSSSDKPVQPLVLPALTSLMSLPVPLVLDASANRTPSNTLTLDEALYQAVSNSWSVKSSDQRQQSFRFTELASRGALFPKLDVRAANGDGRLTSVQPSRKTDRFEQSVTLRQALFDLPAFMEWRRQSRLGDAAALQLRGEISRVMLDASQAWLRVLQAQLTLDALQSYQVSLEEIYTYIDKRAEAGGASRAERERIRARVAALNAQLLESRSALSSAKRTLGVLTGREAAALRLELPELISIPSKLELARQQMEQGNPDLLATEQEMEALALERKSQMARFLPTVTLDVSNLQSRNMSGVINEINDTRILFSASWSLLNGGSDLAQSYATAARRMERAYLREDTVRRLNDELATSYGQLQTVSDRFAALQAEAQANSRVIDAFRLQLQNGNRPVLDLLDALQRSHQNRIELISLALNELLLHLRIAHVTGRWLQNEVQP